MFFLAALEYAILASTFTISKVAAGLSDPLFLIGVRMILAAPLLFLFHFATNKSSLKIKSKDFRLFFFVSLFHIFIPFVGEFWALKYISSVKSAITYSLTPFVAALLSFFLLKKKISRLQCIGLVFGFFGLCSIFLTSSPTENIFGEFLNISLPEIVLLICVVSASYAWFLVSKLIQQGYSVSQINGFSMLIGGALSLGIWFIFYFGTDPLTGSLEDFIIWTSLLILVANIISYNFYGWLLKHISINLMSAIGFLCPIFASIYGYIFLGETLGVSHFVALVMVILGLWLFYKEEIKT